jgi:hypothetical protein
MYMVNYPVNQSLRDEQSIEPSEEPTVVGIKYDESKPDYNLIPAEALDQFVNVLTYGAKKYSPENWRYVANHRYFAAAQRHLWAYKRGEQIDPESGYPHLAHVVCCVMFILEKDLQNIGDENASR